MKKFLSLFFKTYSNIIKGKIKISPLLFVNGNEKFDKIECI